MDAEQKIINTDLINKCMGMKKLIPLLIAAIAIGCNRDALKGNNLYRVVSVDRKGGEVKFKRYRDEKTVVYKCLPDSIVEGKLMRLPAFE